MYIAVYVTSIIYAKKCISEWSSIEDRIDQRVKDYRKFERLFIKDTGGRFQQDDQYSGGSSGSGLPENQRKEYADLKKRVKYIVLRQEFLSPTFLPVMRESVLRDDFRFSGYLAACLFKTIQEVLQLRLTTVFSFLGFLGVYSIIRIVIPENFEVLAMFLVSLLSFFLHLGLKMKTEKIFSQLSHPLNSPYEFQVAPFDAVRNPKSNRDKIFTPNYLRDGFQSIFVSKTKIVNSHEKLFLLSSPVFCMRLLNAILIFQLLWIIVFFSNYYRSVFKSWT